MKPKLINGVWSWVVDWFEHGDLVPLLVVVSAWHYAAVLADADAWPVAIAIGILVDIGHFRTIRAAFRYPIMVKRYKSKRGMRLRINGQLVARWMIALTMTAISLAYHQRYYGDWWLSAPIPFLIAALAWLGQVDGPRKKETTAQPKETKTKPVAKPAKQERNQDNRDAILELHHTQPDATQAQLAEMVGVSRQYVGRIIKANGRAK